MNDTAQVDRLVFVSGQRLIILGSASGVLNTVAVVDVAQGAVVDDFNAYCPAFSPTNRYLAFIKFFPRISASPESSAVTLVYDFDLKPSQDRLATAPMGMAGIPVFPAENRHLQTYAPQVQAPDRHLVPGGYVWESASKFHFADDFRSRVTVVTVNLDRGITAPQITFKVKSK